MFPLIRKAKFKTNSEYFSYLDWKKELNGLNAEVSYLKFHDFYLKTCGNNVPKLKERVKKISAT